MGALNPKNLVMAGAAALAVGFATLSARETVAVAVVYVVLASAGVAAPVILTLVQRDRATATLGTWRAWLERNNDALMAVLYFVFSVVLLWNAFAKS